MSIGKFFLVQNRILSAVKRVQFVSDKMSLTVLQGHSRKIIVLNVHTSEEKSDDSKDSFYEEL
jgi:hypothetical protein